MLLVGLGEALHHVPGLGWLDKTDPSPGHWAVLCAGLAVYAAATLLSCRVSERRFEKIDL